MCPTGMRRSSTRRAGRSSKRFRRGKGTSPPSSPAARSMTSRSASRCRMSSWAGPAGCPGVFPGDPSRPRRSGGTKEDRVRRALAPIFSRLSAFPGVEVEDKGWSVAVHFRGVLPDATPMLEPLIAELAGTPGIRLYRGMQAVEVQLFGNVSKSFGVRRLCRLLKLDPPRTAFSTRGTTKTTPWRCGGPQKRGGRHFRGGPRSRRGARPVDDPAALARAVSDLAEEESCPRSP
jgi:hypothetical protein